MITPSRKKQKAKYLIRFKQFPVFPQFGGPYFDGKIPPRKKVNFMIKEDLLEGMKFFIPQGERSDFVNGTLEEALKDFARKKASAAMDELREKANIRMSTKEFIRLKNYGRQ